MILQSDAMTMTFADADIAELLDYVVENGSQSNSIEELLTMNSDDTSVAPGDDTSVAPGEDTSAAPGEDTSAAPGEDTTDNTSEDTAVTDHHMQLSNWEYDYRSSTARSNELEDYREPTIKIGTNDDDILIADEQGSSLWGGDSGNDTLFGSSARDEFFYLKSNGNDVIENADDKDLINLLNVDFADLEVNTLIEGIGEEAITLKFNDGGSIKVNSASDVSFRMTDGSTWHAVWRGSSNKHWELK